MCSGEEKGRNLSSIKDKQKVELISPFLHLKNEIVLESPYTTETKVYQTQTAPTKKSHGKLEKRSDPANDSEGSGIDFADADVE